MVELCAGLSLIFRRSPLFTRSWQYYDAIYGSTDYEAGASYIVALAIRHGQGTGGRLLDVACGTGRHLSYLSQQFEVEGLDLDPNLLGIATSRNPGLTLHRGDMLDFHLGPEFDIITCLGGSIAAVRTADNLREAISNMVGHLAPGGVLILEPWLSPADYQPGWVDVRVVEQPDLKLVRMGRGTLEGNVVRSEMHYLAGTGDGISHFSEEIALGLFSHEEIGEAMRASGLKVVYDTRGSDGSRLTVVGVLPRNT